MEKIAAQTARWVIRSSSRRGKAKDVAEALGVAESQVSRRASGQRGPELIALEHVMALARGKNTTPFPFLSAMKTEATRAYLEPLPNMDLVKRFHELRDRLEPQAEARMKQAAYGRDRSEYWAALKAESAVQEELAAVDEELSRRGVDPRDYNQYGHRLIRPT